VSFDRIFKLALTGVFAFALTACGAGERLNRLNPFSGPQEDDPNAPEQSRRVAVLELDGQLRADEAGPVVLPRAYVNSAWPQADGFPTHAMQHTNASGPLERVWRESVGSGSGQSRRIKGRPVISGGVVYAVDAEGRVTARNLQSGAERWSRRLRDSRSRGAAGSFIPFVGGRDTSFVTFGGALSFDSGRIYVHTGGLFFAALNAETGEEIWRQESLTLFHSAPTVADGRVFVVTDDNELVAMDANTGDVLWSHRSIAETARLLAAPSPAVLGEVVVAPFSSGEVVALRVQNGTVLWSDSLTRTGGLSSMSSINDIAASPVILGDRAYALSHSGIMAAFDMRTGERVWTLPAGGLHTPAVAGDYLFIVTVDGQVVAIERHTGEVRWMTQLPAFRSERRRRNRISWAGPVLAGDRLVLASSRGDMVLLDPATGEQIGERSLGDSVYIAPVIAQETLVVLTDDARMIAFR